VAAIEQQTTDDGAIQALVKSAPGLKTLIERVLVDVTSVFPACTLPAGHPMQEMLAEDLVLPTVRVSSRKEAPSLLLPGLRDLHLVGRDGLKPATKRLLEEAGERGTINVLVGASGIGLMQRSTSRSLAALGSAPHSCSVHSVHCVAVLQARRARCSRRSVGRSVCISQLQQNPEKGHRQLRFGRFLRRC
jgi:hypothetical protein